jgi:hypothetical protein
MSGEVLVAGCWLLVAGCWLLVAGCWLLVKNSMIRRETSGNFKNSRQK